MIPLALQDKLSQETRKKLAETCPKGKGRALLQAKHVREINIMQKLLLADDHELVRETIADFLRLQGGFDVHTAQSFDEAITMAQSQGPFDLVMLDYSMPGMDALSGLARMRAQTGFAVAILSGTATPDVARRALSSGAAGFLLGAHFVDGALSFGILPQGFA